jgi:uncharacterized membrane protein YdjX (TVP38/TMEM64 family)
VALTVVAVYHCRTELGGRVVEIENWIATLGVWGPLVFLALFVLLTTLFVPDSVLSAAAGALFGVPVGLAVVSVGALAAQCICFAISRRLLRRRVLAVIGGRPKLAAIHRASEQGGVRLQLLLRLTPVSPVAVSHVLGTTGTRLGTFSIGCLALMPSLFVEVYAGYTAKHLVKVAGQVSTHSALETGVVILGLIACIAVFALMTRMAQKAITRAGV